MKRILLAGNPNGGKSTLFNALTGAGAKVGNWPGVTVEKKEAVIRFAEFGDCVLTDLPGAYSLNARGVEERVAAEALNAGAADAVICVADACCPARSLYLALQLRDARLPLIAALNMTDDLEARGGRIDCEKLSSLLGFPIVPISAKRRAGLAALLFALSGRLRARESAAPLREISPERAALFRYAELDGALRASGFVPPSEKENRLSERLDDLLLNRFWAFPAFFLLLSLGFFLAFGPLGSALVSVMERLILMLRAAAGALLAPAPLWARSLLMDGALAGVGAVIGFLPQILMLFLTLTLMEDFGYMARAAFIADRPLRRAGLSGRSFIPLLMGFGCTTAAAAAARAVDGERDRLMTLLLLPFMSCGARLPVYGVFAAALFPDNRFLLIAGLYLLGVILMALVGGLYKRLLFSGEEAPLLLELPPYRLPDAANLFRRLGERTGDFLRRAGTLIFALSVLVWFLRSYTPDLRWSGGGADSAFAALGRLLAPPLMPLGFGDWQRSAALLTGLVAKEAVLSTLGVVYAAAAPGALAEALRAAFTPSSGLAFLVFTLLYAPCASAVLALGKELGSRRLLLIALLVPLVLSYGLAFLCYRLGGLIWPC